MLDRLPAEALALSIGPCVLSLLLIVIVLFKASDSIASPIKIERGDANKFVVHANLAGLFLLVSLVPAGFPLFLLWQLQKNSSAVELSEFKQTAKDLSTLVKAQANTIRIRPRLEPPIDEDVSVQYQAERHTHDLQRPVPSEAEGELLVITGVREKDKIRITASRTLPDGKVQRWRSKLWQVPEPVIILRQPDEASGIQP
jgi:hypothetical protein